MTEYLFLRDMFSLLSERASEARTRAQQADQATDAASDFEAGRAEAYYEVLSTLVHQLDAFDIPRSAVGLPVDLDLERELL